MRLPELENCQRYVGLYVVDFGDSASVGFTAEEVAELLESEKFKHITVYKIYNAQPDGRIELKGVPSRIFELEAGMFFYSADVDTAEKDFKNLVAIAVKSAPPSRAKVHLAKYDEQKFVTTIIYPAEYDDEFSAWLGDSNYKTQGPAEGGTKAVQQYYDSAPEILRRHQLFGQSEHQNRSGEELLAAVRMAVQR
ncbi:MAG: hypothetical protein ABIG61_11585 [Planctomycetota bacterium]